MRMSTEMIGEVLGKTAKEVNLLLKDKGFFDGKPGNWVLTELGKQFGEMRQKDNGHGGYAKREWKFAVWDENIVNKLKKK